MPDAVYADPSERLPWLPNAAPAPPRKRRRFPAPLLVSAAAAGALAVGTWAWLEYGPAPESPPARSIETVPLPPPSVTSPADAVPEPPSVAERSALRRVAAPATEPVTKPSAPRQKRAKDAQASRIVRSETSAVSAYDPQAWRSGIPGRIIQLGAFATSAQAQSEWRRVYSRYPLLRPLSPRVIRSRIRGRTYYRLQLGTFSQAHSELLCQRLRATGEGCIVLGLPARGTRR